MARGTDNRIDIADPFARRLMARYLSRREAAVESLRSALAGRDFESIRLTEHNLFGSGGTYGLDRVTRLGTDLEAATQTEHSDAIGQLIDELESYIRQPRVV